ncbi:hypothetical protein Slin15195_G052890 [Septoria linicola]|uniref:Uncharacterized protein n=1 Tax=Septoria linicola TaxID=215465 RepID=A0A9Q9ASY2_9PEZI|nr:hypothetical protein Slin14017_G123680 [Septoria linicola]USW51970.1 hypothetical protein Slin15195_G052890 [Septoria linicola]
MATTAPSPAWLARTQKRRVGDNVMLRRPSEVPSTYSTHSTITNSIYSTYSNEPTDASPSSPHSSVSTTNSSIPENFEKLQALQTQVQKNNAQIAANEERMREILRRDDERGAMLSKRLAEVSQLNKQLDMLSTLFYRAEKVAMGDYHAGLSE